MHGANVLSGVQRVDRWEVRAWIGDYLEQRGDSDFYIADVRRHHRSFWKKAEKCRDACRNIRNGKWHHVVDQSVGFLHDGDSDRIERAQNCSSYAGRWAEDSLHQWVDLSKRAGPVLVQSPRLRPHAVMDPHEAQVFSLHFFSLRTSVRHRPDRSSGWFAPRHDGHARITSTCGHFAVGCRRLPHLLSAVSAMLKVEVNGGLNIQESNMSELFALPPGVVEHEICQFLDAPSLARLSCTNRELHEEIGRSQHWATHVSRNFGIAANKISPFSSSPSSSALPLAGLLQNINQQSITKHSAMNSLIFSQQATISWRDVFLAAWMDSLALATAMRDHDILQVYHRHPQVMLSQPESKIRDEIVLMQGLRRFPSSSSLLSLYAQVIRQELLLVRMVR